MLDVANSTSGNFGMEVKSAGITEQPGKAILTTIIWVIFVALPV